jgi:uncharacterized protein (UPF0276 family)
MDVNNIYVNALNQVKAGESIDPLQSCQEWLDQIPPNVVAEIHLAGHNVMDDIVIDDHSCEVADPVWALYKYAIKRFGQIQTLIEWDTDVPALAVLITQAQRAKTCALDAMS